MVTKVSQVKDIVSKGIQNPKSVFDTIKKMATDSDWKAREVAATALLEIGKKKPDEVIAEMKVWAKNKDENIRRCASESLRGVARNNLKSVLPVIEQLKSDACLYVKKSVANILRNAGRYDPDFVFGLCKNWLKVKDKNTNWIIKDGMKKCNPAQREYLRKQLGKV